MCIGNVKFQIKLKTKEQIKCLKVNLEMIQRFKNEIISEQNLFIYFV
jgi:hypothetical protein